MEEFNQMKLAVERQMNIMQDLVINIFVDNNDTTLNENLTTHVDVVPSSYKPGPTVASVQVLSTDDPSDNFNSQFKDCYYRCSVVYCG